MKIILPEVKSHLQFVRVFFLIIFLTAAFCQSVLGQDKIELKRADELSGKVIEGQNVREANGNVEFAQGNVKVFCNSAIQYIDGNRVDLKGDVRIYQDTLSLFTSSATYFGDDRRATCEGGVTLKDPNATIRSDKGIYFFNDSKAIFTGDVIIINPKYRITSGELTYMRNTEDSFARGNVIVTTDSATIRAASIDFYKSAGRTFALGSVRIESDSTIITSDTAVNYSKQRKSEAWGNVKIVSLTNNSIFYGNNIDNFEIENYTILRGNARMMDIEKDSDTLFIYCDTMEAYRRIPDYYVAKNNVEVIRDKFYSKCGLGIYFKVIETVSLSKQPVVWQENLQMTGDSIFAELPNNQLQTIYVKKLPAGNSTFSFVLSKNNDVYFRDRYDQISGNDISIKFISDKIKLIDVDKNSSSIYYVYEDDKANGVNKVEGENMEIHFDTNEKVSRINVKNNPKGEYVPEILLSSVNLKLPGFTLREDKPVRK